MKKVLKQLSGLALTAALAVSAALPIHAASFTDVPDGEWYAQAADFCQRFGLMSGTGDGTFNPNGVMTRAMAVTILYQLAGSPKVQPGTELTDVPAGAWYQAPVTWAIQTGAASGYGDGRFGPNDPITREQLAVLLWQQAGSPSVRAADFADESAISPYAAQAVDWARTNGILSGDEVGRFSPRSPASRAQAAVIFQKYTSGYNVSRGPDGLASAMDIMCEPSGIVQREDGSLLVTDTYHKVIWLVEDGVSSIYAGGETTQDLYGQPMGGYNDSVLLHSYFRRPWGIAPFLDGWAVSDADNNVVRLVRPKNTETVNGRTQERLTITDMGVAFDYPTGLAAGQDGSLYISDTGGGAIRRVTPKGEVTTVASGLSEPMGLCWTKDGLYVAETGANRILLVSGGRVQVLAGSGEEGRNDGPAGQATFSGPQGVAVGEDGAVYIADTGSSAVRQLRDGQVSTLAARDWSGMASCPVSPVGLLVREDGLYVCDNFARRVFVIPLP